MTSNTIRAMLRDWIEEQKPKYVGLWNKDTRFPLGQVRLDGVFDFAELESLITYFAECQYKAGQLSARPIEPTPSTWPLAPWPYEEEED